MSNLGEAFVNGIEVAKTDRFPKLLVAVDLDAGELFVCSDEFRKVVKHLGNAAMGGFGNDEPSEFLDGSRFATTTPFASFAHFPLESIAKCGRAEPFAYVVHERNNCCGEDRGIATLRRGNFDELFQARARVTFPEWNAALKECAKGSCSDITWGEY